LFYCLIIGKEKNPTRTYNATVDHHRKFLNVTPGHPGRWNDKTLVLFDEYVQKIRNGEILDDVKFFLYEKGTDGKPQICWYHGGWLMTDNGYLPWSVTVPPMKTTTNLAELRWSKWEESMRKDVECAFAILKGRWLILKAGIRYGDVTDADKIFKTCVALHNWLLNYDGLDKEWKSGKKSDWEGPLGVYVPLTPSAARIFARVSSGTDSQNRHLGFGLGNDASEHHVTGDERLRLIDPTNQQYEVSDGSRVVRKMPLQLFRSKLVEHFDIQFNRHRPHSRMGIRGVGIK
jgi:hypothetical protein